MRVKVDGQIKRDESMTGTINDSEEGVLIIERVAWEGAIIIKGGKVRVG
jgi:hypothetical protein